ANHLINQSLTGSYVMSGAQASNDRIKETGDYTTGTVTRSRLMTSDSTSNQVGSHLTFSYTQSAKAHNVYQVDGTVHINSGDYDLTISSAATNNVLAQTEHNQTMSADQTGQTLVTATATKVGNNWGGDFTLTTDTVTSAGSHRVEKNQTL